MEELIGNEIQNEFILGENDDSIQTGIVADDLIEDTATATENGENIVNDDDNGILVELGDSLITGDGADTIIGNAEANSEEAILIDGIENQGFLDTDDGDDTIIGDAFGSGVGVVNVGGIDNGLALVDQEGIEEPQFRTGEGNDEIIAVAEATATSDNHVAITAALSNFGGGEEGGGFFAEDGDDFISATAVSTSVGPDGNALASDAAIADAIDNRGLFLTGSGNDTIVATAIGIADEEVSVVNAIDQSNVEANTSRGVINLQSGDDTIIAETMASSINDIESIAIFGGSIQAGAGNDSIRARSDQSAGFLGGNLGFGGGVNIDMGFGDDSLLGFGDARVNGGDGFDVLQFEFTEEDFIRRGGQIEEFGNSINFTRGSITYSTLNFEAIEFGVDFNDDNVIAAREQAAAAGDRLIGEII